MTTWRYLIYLILLATFIYKFYKYLTKNNGYWKIRGIPEAKGAVFGIGHMKKVFLLEKNVATYLQDFIEKDHPNSSMIGIYELSKPVLIIKDPNLIKFVLQTGFRYFKENFTLDKDLDPLFSREPLLQSNQEWRESRGLVTNAFSIKKIKEKIPLIHDVSKKLLNYIDTKVPSSSSSESESVEMKNLFSKYTASVSASVILGINAETFVDNEPPDSLCSMIDAIFHPKSLSLNQIITPLSPRLAKFLGIGYVPAWINKSFQQIVDDVVSARRSENIPRNDTLQLIIDHLRDKKESDKLAAAHAFGMFVETYETTSLALSTMAYYLAKHAVIQDKARKEINKILMNHGDELTYEALNEMEYMDQMIREALRLIPPGGRLIKNCTEPVTLEGSDGLKCNLKKGDQVVIPVYCLHRNPEYWQDPDEFRPERFDKNNDIKYYQFLPFGHGLRACPGKIFSFPLIKIVMAVILINYVLEPSNKINEPIKIDAKCFFTTIKGGYWVNMRRLLGHLNK